MQVVSKMGQRKVWLEERRAGNSSRDSPSDFRKDEEVEA
jgi:hypothetical protein